MCQWEGKLIWVGGVQVHGLVKRAYKGRPEGRTMRSAATKHSLRKWVEKGRGWLKESWGESRSLTRKVRPRPERGDDFVWERGGVRKTTRKAAALRGRDARGAP